jgi:hypothetical protein
MFVDEINDLRIDVCNVRTAMSDFTEALTDVQARLIILEAKFARVLLESEK